MTNLSLIQFHGLLVLFSAGMGIGLVFHGAAEPMAHFATPPTADPKTTEAYTEALTFNIFPLGIPCLGCLWCCCVSVGIFAIP